MARRLRIKKTIRALCSAAAVLGCFFVSLAAASYYLVETDYTLYSDKISTPVRVALISDLHDSNYGSEQSQIIDMMKNAVPDIVLITGDIYDDKLPNDNTRVFMERAGESFRCFYVPGNHELDYPDKYREYRKEIYSYGIEILENYSVDVGELCITGFAQTPEKGDFLVNAGEYAATEEFMSLADNGRYNILMTHYPDHFDYYESLDTFDLTVCGHTHGGQWRLPWKQEGLFGPGGTFFPEYSGGPYEKNRMTMIVSHGLSRDKERLPRLFNNPEVVIIDIKPEL